jgi:hypothetical protein
MRDIFIVWIMLQLILIGIATVDINNKISNGTYQCSSSEERISVLWGALLPLTVFTDGKTEEVIIKYCEEDVNIIK